MNFSDEYLNLFTDTFTTLKKEGGRGGFFKYKNKNPWFGPSKKDMSALEKGLKKAKVPYSAEKVLEDRPLLNKLKTSIGGFHNTDEILNAHLVKNQKKIPIPKKEETNPRKFGVKSLVGAGIAGGIGVAGLLGYQEAEAPSSQKSPKQSRIHQVLAYRQKMKLDQLRRLMALQQQQQQQQQQHHPQQQQQQQQQRRPYYG